jgi:hypothetical protein
MSTNIKCEIDAIPILGDIFRLELDKSGISKTDFEFEVYTSIRAKMSGSTEMNIRYRAGRILEEIYQGGMSFETFVFSMSLLKKEVEIVIKSI